MTRFARAHGSKASNERQPEEATSWNVLKNQLLEQQTASKNKVKEASNPITKHPFVLKKNETKITEWAEFEETSGPKHTKKVKKKVKLGRAEEKLVESVSYEEQHANKSKLHKIKNNRDTKNIKKHAKKLKKIKDLTFSKEGKLHDAVSENLDTNVTKDELQVKLSKREKRKNKLKAVEKSVETSNADTKDIRAESKMASSVDGPVYEHTKRQLKRIRNLKKKQQNDGFVRKRPDERVDGKNMSIPPDASTLENTNDVNGQEPKLSKRQKDKKRSQLKKQLKSTSIINQTTNEEMDTSAGHGFKDTSQGKLQVGQTKRQKRNLKKLGDPTQVRNHKRRKPHVQSTTMVINGQEVEVSMFDGFPVLKQDADRLNELRKQMTDNGIPPKEIEETMKLERRKAEKTLAREKRRVCFHCRKGGHNISECPELDEGSNQDAAGTGICYKCGSTEHTHFQCRVVRGQDFRFAKCFICQEQGHITRQCPDNPRGLYPKGGSCKVCGDVTHLKKDCPDLYQKKEQNVITLDTARGDRLEALDEDLNTEDKQPAVNAPKNKIIKFF